MNDRGISASSSLSPLSIITHPKNTSQFILIEDCSSKRVNDLLIHNTIPITLYDVLLTFRDIEKEFELQGDLSKMITNKNYNVNVADLRDKNIIYDFAKEINFDVKAPGNKSTRDRSLIRLLKPQFLMISASGISNTIHYQLI